MTAAAPSHRDPLRPWIPAVLLLDGLLLAVFQSFHEPWFNEAQAWLLARDHDLGSLFAEALRYEGTTGLWHLLLWVPAHLGLPYASLQVLSAGLALFAAWLLLRYGPFSVATRLLLPLGYFFFFEYGIVARSYSLLAPLLFLLALRWPERERHPWSFVLLLSLLAQVSVHGLLLAIGFLGVHLLRVWRLGDYAAWRAFRGPLFLFLGVLAFDLWQLWPPSDLSEGSEWSTDPFWWLRVAALSVDFAFVGGVLPACLLLGLSVRWLRQRRSLDLLLIPSGLVLLLFMLKRASPWHAGILWVLWIAVLWMAARDREPPGRTARLNPSLAFALLVAALANVAFTARALAYDVSNPYSGAAATAEWIREQRLEHAPIQAYAFHTGAVLAYFERNIFRNWNDGGPPAAWRWSKGFGGARAAASIVQGRPEIVLWGVKRKRDRVLPVLEGYEQVGYFPGGIFCKLAVFEPDDIVVFRRKSDPSSAAEPGR